MKRVVIAASNSADLRRDLHNDLVENFEDNIVMKYSKYINDDPTIQLDSREQKFRMDDLDKARRNYVKALAEVIQFVDVNDYVNENFF